MALRIFSDRQAEQCLTWAELERLMLQAAGKIQRAGTVNVGDHVASWLPNGLAWILVDLACQWMGWVHVAVDTRLPANMASDLVRHSQSRLLVLDKRNRADVAHLQHCPVVDAQQLEEGGNAGLHENQTLNRAHIDDQCPAQLMYTSGTISQPKGALLSHRNLFSNAQAKLSAAPQRPDDVRLNILPFAHAYARTCELSTWILSGSQLCIADNWETFLWAAPIVQPSLVNLVPHLVYRLIEQLDRADSDASPPLGSHLRLLQVGGASLREEVWHRLAALGWPPLQGYGLTETSPVICSNRAGHQRYECVGPPVDGVEIRLDNAGVLWTRGPHVMLNYWQDEASTREKIQDGWFCTGDLAEQLEDGSVRILGRADDQIALSTGYKVGPLELTRRLSADPWLENVVLVGQDRPFVAALVYPRLKWLPPQFTEVSAEGVTLNKHALAEAFIERWRHLTSDLPRSMQIERVAIMHEPLTVANGGLNFKGAVRRQFVELHLCRDEVAQLFNG